MVLAIGLALVLQALVTFRSRREDRGLDAVQMLVHDMRSPLQVIVAHLERLGNHPSETSRRCRGGARRSRDVAAMTTSFLDVSRLEADGCRCDHPPRNSAVLARSVVTAVRVLQPTRAISVETDGDSTCDCDPELTRRIIENLVSNAMKHTPIESGVRVVTSGSRDRAFIEVHDEGPGVSPETRTTNLRAVPAPMGCEA